MKNKEKYIINIVIVILMLGCLFMFFWGCDLTRGKGTQLEKDCIQLLEDTKNKCDYTIKVDAWSWDCNDEEVYQKMILRNKTGLFCVEKAYTEPYETTVTYTCKLESGIHVTKNLP